MTAVAISSTGLFTPPFSISNEELVASYNAYAARYNAQNAAAIESGALPALEMSSTEFIEKASGIKSRYVMDKDGILDIDIMTPRIPERPNEQISVMAEMGIKSANDALARAGRDAKDVDAIICAASNMQRAYPAVGIEMQEALGIDGFGYDLVCGCGAAAFGVAAAADHIRAGRARSILVVSPEITTAHNNHRNRDSHFIFGDLSTAVLVEAADMAPPNAWAVLGIRLKSKFSNNIRNNFGFLNNADPAGIGQPDKLFIQEGRRVFKEVVPLVSDMILSHMAELNLSPDLLRRMWLHQANSNMIRLIASRVLGREATEDESPMVLQDYGNTSSAGAVIAFHKHSDDLKTGDRGLICAFGAGYSAATIFVAKAA